MADLPPGQLLFKIGEAAAKLGLESHVLRYWEKEFKAFIKPVKTGPRKRLYRPEDLDTFREIKRLLHDERFTIEGAKKQIAQGQPQRHRLFAEAEEGLGPILEEGAGPEEKSPASPRLKSPAAPGAEEFRVLLGEIRLELLGLRDFLLTRGEAPEAPTGPEEAAAKTDE
ncbi:MAG: MerR family transcriptional regulator [Deltaproteobacteria bacterium]|jgi:DNA-binding transcriptional MerR regulator|nr:MerR family transcriptional regulator [Deltaproteobacteria bacterium]